MLKNLVSIHSVGLRSVQYHSDGIVIGGQRIFPVGGDMSEYSVIFAK